MPRRKREVFYPIPPSGGNPEEGTALAPVQQEQLPVRRLIDPDDLPAVFGITPVGKEGLNALGTALIQQLLTTELPAANIRGICSIYETMAGLEAAGSAPGMNVNILNQILNDNG
jgi:hypothetical protein